MPKPHIMLLDTSLEGHGGATVTRELAAALARAGNQVTVRVCDSNGADVPGVTVTSLPLDSPNTDKRSRLAHHDRLPGGVDILMGAGRFSGPAALHLRDTYYPSAKVIHVVHAEVDMLDRVRGDPAQANRHLKTESDLISRSDLAVGIGPLLADEAAWMAQGCKNPPPVHDLVGTTINTPPRYRDSQRQATITIFGRTSDELKGVDIAESMAINIHQHGNTAFQLVVRGVEQDNLTSTQESLQEGLPCAVKVRPFTSDHSEIEADLRRSDLVVVPSRIDGFALTATEAAGMGVPVLTGSNIGAGMFFGDASRVPAELGGPCVVPMTGREPAEELGRRWADHAEPLLRDLPATRARALDLRQFLAEHYTWDHAAAGLMDRVRELPGFQAHMQAQATERSLRAAGVGQRARMRAAAPPRRQRLGRPVPRLPDRGPGR